VTPSDYWGSDEATPWQTYLDRQRTARDGYLLLVERAHKEYLTGPFPDRSAYEVVERAAWVTYYAAGRGAWHAYRADMDTAGEARPTPPPESHPYPPAYAGNDHSNPWPTARDVSPYPVSSYLASGAAVRVNHDPDVQSAWIALETQYGLNCPECGIPWRQPSPACSRMVHDVHPRQPAFTPRPEGAPLDYPPAHREWVQAPDPNPESES